MGSGTFRGGIHPYDGKELSRDRAIQDIRPGKELAYLVSQHIGAPAKPIVKKGDRVLVGQMIQKDISVLRTTNRRASQNCRSW